MKGQRKLVCVIIHKSRNWFFWKSKNEIVECELGGKEFLFCLLTCSQRLGGRVPGG